MKKLVWFILFLPFVLQAQGIKFEQSLSWQHVKEKARAENKYIFVDCYASWCGPCKLMDKEVYPNDSVGVYMNMHFIAFKVQIDTSKTDDDKTREQYQDAHEIKRQYNITAFPSYLFLSPQGNIVHRALGFMNADSFLKLAANALTPTKQYYTLIDNYRQGRQDYRVMPYLIKTASDIDEKGIADTILQDYVNNYLLNLRDSELYTTENIELLGPAVRTSKDRAFQIFYSHADKVDKLIKWHKNYSQWIIDFIITKEEITSNINAANKERLKPNWNQITRNISSKYDASYAERNVLNAKISWYQARKDWPEYLRLAIFQVEKYGVDTTTLQGDVGLNNLAWDGIFLHSTEKKEIDIGIQWTKSLVKRHPNDPGYLDTYANLLYKAGSQKKAILIEEKVAQLKPDDKETLETLAKMRHGKPTWLL